MTATNPLTLETVVTTWAARAHRAVIFDFNGTLSDDEPILEAVFREIFAQHLGWEMTPEDYRRELLGRSDREIVEVAVRTHGDGDPTVVELLLGLRRELYQRAIAQQSPVAPETVALVRRLAAGGVPMAIVTGAQRADVRAVIDQCGVGTLITHLVTEEDVRQGKPDPEGFLQGARLLGVEADDVLVFEDSVWGIRAARSAGMACVAVTGPGPSPEVLGAAPAVVARLSVDVLAGTDL